MTNFHFGLLSLALGYFAWYVPYVALVKALSAGLSAALTDEQTARICALASDFPALWSDPVTPQRERKRMIRLLITDVTLVKTDRIHLHIPGGGSGPLDVAVGGIRADWLHNDVHQVVQRVVHSFGHTPTLRGQRGSDVLASG
jgi:hypothetical protein